MRGGVAWGMLTGKGRYGVVCRCDPYLSALEAFAKMRYTNRRYLYPGKCLRDDVCNEINMQALTSDLHHKVHEILGCSRIVSYLVGTQCMAYVTCVKLSCSIPSSAGQL